ncbi:MAG: amidase [Lachnospiraceae bacterium]|nr:amidase [Lachnospiraceae bacterium]
MERLELLSAAELGKEILARNLGPKEVVRYFADRIEAYNKDINAFVYTKTDEALEAAGLLDKRLAAKEDTGVFSGVPFGLKDFLPSKKGWTNTHGGVKSLTAVDAYDSVFTAAMEKAGGVAIGKTNAPAFGFRGTTDNKLFGPTKNPFDTRYNSGGSSGGSAAAVAAGLVPVSEGGDAGGSVRIPASWCNLVGFKASAGLIPNYCRPDAFCATHPYCTPGGLVKTVEDARLLFELMRGYDERDPLSIRFSDIMPRDIKGLRIAFTYDFDSFAVDEEAGKIVYAAAKKMEDAGAVVEPVSFNLKRDAYEYACIWDMAITIDSVIEFEHKKKEGFDLIGDHMDELPEEFIYWYKRAAALNIMDYHEWNLARTEIFDAHREVFKNYDLIISPVTACPPVLNTEDGNTKGPEMINGRRSETLIGFCETFYENILGNPACSVPAGFTKEGLPVGMQIIGNRLNDLLVLHAAEVYEKINPWRDDYRMR